MDDAMIFHAIANAQGKERQRQEKNMALNTLGLVKVATNIISENIPHAQRYQPINAGAVSPLKKMINKAHVHQKAP